MNKYEELIMQIAEKYKKIFCTLIKTGREANLTQLLRDESKPYSSSLSILDYAKENLSADQRYIIHVHFCLSLLTPEEREIVWRDFFIIQPKVNKLDWWDYKYARSTYYRLRSKAVRKFYEICR